MTESSSGPLHKATELLRAGDKHAALVILKDYVQSHPNSEQAWFLLSFTLDSRQDKIDSLRRVLQLNRKHIKAKTRLAKLLGKKPATSKRKKTAAKRKRRPFLWALLGGAAILALVAMALVSTWLFINNRPNQPAQVAEQEMTQPATPAVTNVGEVIASVAATVISSDTPSATPTATATADITNTHTPEPTTMPTDSELPTPTPAAIDSSTPPASPTYTHTPMPAAPTATPTITLTSAPSATPSGITELTTAGLLYTRQIGESTGVFRMSLDGTDEVMLFTDPDSPAALPQWSRNGTLIAFVTYEGGQTNRQRLYMITPNGQLVIPLTEPGQINIEDENGNPYTPPQWSASGRYIVFQGPGSAGTSDVFRIDITTRAIVNLTNSPAVWDGQPNWSANPEFIAYVADHPSPADPQFNKDIFGILADDQPPTPLLNNNGASTVQYPAYSMDSSQMAFFRDSGLAYINTPELAPGLWVAGSDGSGERLLWALSHEYTPIGPPQWSPNGQHIAFSYIAAGRTEIAVWVVSLAGNDASKLSTQPGDNVWPQWSPNSAALVYTNINGDERRLFVTNIDGSIQGQVGAEDGLQRAHASWTPQ